MPPGLPSTGAPAESLGTTAIFKCLVRNIFAPLIRYARRASDKEIIALGPWIEQTSNAKGWCLTAPAPHPKTRGHGPIKGDGGNPSRRHRPSPPVMHARLIVRGKLNNASAGVSILADTIGVVDGRLVAGTNSLPQSAGRRCRASRGAARTKGAAHAHGLQGAARPALDMADGGHRHLPRSRDGGFDCGRHHRDGPGRLGDGIQPPLTA